MYVILVFTDTNYKKVKVKNILERVSLLKLTKENKKYQFVMLSAKTLNFGFRLKKQAY